MPATAELRPPEATVDSKGQRMVTLEEAKQWAREALQKGNLAEARLVANQLLASAPADPEAWMAAAKVELLIGHMSMASLLADIALALAPGFADAHEVRRAIENARVKAAEDPFTLHYEASRSRYLNYPATIQIEVTGRCNATCVFCPHGQLDRRHDEMSDELFAKIVRDAAAIPPSSPLMLYLNVVNEPFMDKKIFSRIAALNAAIPHAQIGLYSNMGVRPPNFFENLRKIQRLSEMNVSFNAANEAEYQASMGIDFQRTVTNIRDLLNDNREHRYLSNPVTLSRISTGDNRDLQFVRECQTLFSDFDFGTEFTVVCRPRTDWLGQQDCIQTPIPYLAPCNFWLSVSILCDGTVAHCCMDAKGQFPYGNVKDKSILEIYNSPKFRHQRLSVAARETIYPCNTCSMR